MLFPAFNHLRKSLFFTALIFIAICPPSLDADSSAEIKNVLIIHPFSEAGNWSINFNTGFQSEISENDSYTIAIFYHFLKTDISSLDEKNISFNELKILSESYKFDAIIGVFPPVHEFLIKQGETLFQGIPKVLVPAIQPDIEKIRYEDNYFYIKSNSELAIIHTIEDIKQLIPDLKHLYVLSGTGDTDIPYLNIFRKDVGRYIDEDIIEYWIGNPVDEIFALAAGVPDKSAIMLLTINFDNEGNPYKIINQFQKYSEIAAAPIFSFYDNVFGLGIAGGTMTSAENYGRHAAETFINIISGNINLIDETVDTTDKKYDWRQLKRWDLDLSRVPGNAEILFAEETFWSKYKNVLIAALSIILVQGTTIIFLYFEVKRRKKLHRELENQHIELSQSLEQKNILLKEVHHRVKNNLSLIKSFLSLQSDYIDDEAMLKMLRKLENRVYAMSLVHEQLYRDDKIEKIDIAEYLRELCSILNDSYIYQNKRKINFDLNIESMNLVMDVMIPVGLIFNELITNSVIHAFGETSNPRVRIEGKLENNEYRFVYSDNGIGLPNNIGSDKNDSLGMLIVKTLILQLNSELIIERSGRDSIIFSIRL